MEALREIEANFNNRINQQGQNRNNLEDNLGAIEKRARLQREIDTLIAEADSIKAMEQQMVHRMDECLKIKRS